MNLNPLFSLSTIGAAVLVVAGCAAPSTPVSRIAAHPQIYESLPAEDQQLAAEGRIQSGMSRDAVFIAWGRPRSATMGSRKGVPFESWIYTRMRAVDFPYPGFGYGFGYGYGFRHRGHYHHRYPYFWGGFPYGSFWYEVPVGRVEFLNNRVDSWEGRF